MPDRQAIKLPDQGAKVDLADDNRRRRAIMAGLVTSPQGALGTPMVSKPKLG